MILNMIKAIVNRWHYMDWLIYVVSFFIVVVIYMFIDSFKLDAWIIFVCAVMCIVFGDWGNLSGASFLIFSIYMMRFKEKLYILFGIIIIATVVKFLFFLPENGLINTVMYLIGFEFIVVFYFNNIHPGVKVNIDEDEINIQIIELLMEGNRVKEVAERLSLTDNAICKRIEKMRAKYECGNNIQLVCKFMKNGDIKQK